MKKKPDYADEAAYFRDECTKFRGIVQHATTVGNAIGVRDVGEIRGYASWLFVRACLMSRTIENAFNPIPTGFGSTLWLDHASITILCRALIECISVMLYIGDVDASDDEWDCRKRLFILHELVNRGSFLSSIDYDFDTSLKETQLAYAKNQLSENPFFKSLPERRQKRLIDADDMYVDGRHEAMLKIGWGAKLTRGPFQPSSFASHGVRAYSPEQTLYDR